MTKIFWGPGPVIVGECRFSLSLSLSLQSCNDGSNAWHCNGPSFLAFTGILKFTACQLHEKIDRSNASGLFWHFDSTGLRQGPRPGVYHHIPALPASTFPGFGVAGRERGRERPSADPALCLSWARARAGASVRLSFSLLVLSSLPWPHQIPALQWLGAPRSRLGILPCSTPGAVGPKN